MGYGEHEQVPPATNKPWNLVNAARSMIEHNIVKALCAGITAPADTVDAPSEREKWGTGYSRMYSAPTRASEDRTQGGQKVRLVNALTVQFDDGRIERHIAAQVRDHPMTASEIRHLAGAPVDAADDQERMRGTKPRP